MKNLGRGFQHFWQNWAFATIRWSYTSSYWFRHNYLYIIIFSYCAGITPHHWTIVQLYLFFLISPRGFLVIFPLLCKAISCCSKIHILIGSARPTYTTSSGSCFLVIPFIHWFYVIFISQLGMITMPRLYALVTIYLSISLSWSLRKV